MVQVKAQIIRKSQALAAFGLSFLFCFSTGCTHGPLSHVPPFRAVPPEPVLLDCSASPNSVFAGDPVTVTATASGLNPKEHAIYSWSVNGVTGSDTTATVNTSALAPGTYTVNCAVKEGEPGQEGLRPWQIANSSTTFTVKEFEPPTISCTANPTNIMPGESATVTATGMGPQNRPLTYSYSAAAGTINGSGTTATFNSIGAPTGSVQITCNVADDKGHYANASTDVTIVAPPPPPAPQSPALHSGYSCNASPARVRPGDPVELYVAPLRPGDSAEWNIAGGVLDSSGGTAVVDTSRLTARTVRTSAVVVNTGQPIGECETAFTVDPTAPVIPWTTLDLVRTQLKRGQTEAPGFAVYTYVLYRKKPSTSDDIARFRNILTAIGAYSAPEDFGQHALEQTAGDHPAPIPPRTQVTPRRKLAEIVVPVTESGPFTVDWLYDNYDPALAATLIRHLNCELATDANSCVSKLSGDGPYLISTLVRLTGQPEAVLVQNLEGTSPEAGGQWVTAWMTMVRQKRNWTSAYTMQRASMAFARQLDLLGISLTNAQTSVTTALGFIRMGQKH